MEYLSIHEDLGMHLVLLTTPYARLNHEDPGIFAYIENIIYVYSLCQDMGFRTFKKKNTT